jgi:hypothetical protein
VGHCGIHGNEEADALARAGSNFAFVGRSLVFHWHLQVSDGESVSGYLNHSAPHGAWRLLVVSRECGKKNTNPGLMRYLLSLPRSKLRILVGLITGNCPLNKYLHNMGLIDELTVRHSAVLRKKGSSFKLKKKNSYHRGFFPFEHAFPNKN